MSRYRLPNAAAPKALDMNEVHDVALRLNDLVVMECELLSNMRLRELHAVQEEKLRLSALFDKYQQVIATDQQFAETISPDMRDRLYLIASELAGNIEENMRLTAIAQNVNRSVLQIFVGAIAENERATTYSGQGQTETGSDVTISLNINERA